jgi:hypothetical protein
MMHKRVSGRAGVLFVLCQPELRVTGRWSEYRDSDEYAKIESFSHLHWSNVTCKVCVKAKLDEVKAEFDLWAKKYFDLGGV